MTPELVIIPNSGDDNYERLQVRYDAIALGVQALGFARLETDGLSKAWKRTWDIGIKRDARPIKQTRS